ncbi:bifunctional diaminohydroxyphosphoribosylaminopyrimidine deaminase/5-amino-6-(5-phosphoribosylamino)uracil reductase RibD [Actinomadura sp. ATCC 31491]|uniref:Riboflavin biosynthesis protein RibD n=1 Tax=Actinomadura luzonensis TaxID=2805427 RepID=A0ABT0G9A0_9ACTN|nr:bifunctional diaminohydroxyphosphoribosylaminopyrimidine deaminase/5-amino-6-(5-phosphoribosylamino)uracil reductase RibD [Actinomadura luzonensis]MCK2220815.1 bifunctional diaminohydroxyphosphoribosylaminopyrimidine deaminase/5-amino-6-(5-phosphoribosylamino)uracil reductase RibD [Actinomadura luzonensis]
MEVPEQAPERGAGPNGAPTPDDTASSTAPNTASNSTASDAGHMARAVALAARGLGTTSPNPVVGCVVLDAGGAVAGEGFHAYAGGPHAEVVALAQAGERARGGTAYVTLEPCDHTGRTGPCSRALLDAGIARVVVAVADPNPKAAGGAARLRAAGVAVTTGVLAAEAERVNEAWLTYARLGRAHVTWKFAATLDGRSAAEDGTSQWITSPEARADVHRLRAAADAIVAGIGTVLADDPRLTARPAEARPAEARPAGTGSAGPRDRAARRAPLRVVVDTDARTPPGARVLDDQAPTLVAVADDAPASHLKADVLRLPRHGSGLDLGALLTELAAREVVGVFLEGGPTLAGSFLRAGLIDRVVAYVAPALLGSGRAALGPAGADTISAIHRLTFDEISPIGPDVRLIARPVAQPSREQ